MPCYDDNTLSEQEYELHPCLCLVMLMLCMVTKKTEIILLRVEHNCTRILISGFWVANYPVRNISWKKKVYRILLVFEISNNKISISSRFRAFSDLNILYLEISCPNVIQENETENETEVEKEIM